MRHFNNTINKSMSDTFNLKGESTDEILDNIVPVVIVEPKVDIVIGSTLDNGTSLTLYTTPTDKDFYLTTAQMNVIKDVTSTSNRSRLLVTINGVSQQLLTLASLTLTPQNITVAQNYRIPIKLDRNTGVIITNSTNVANISTSASISGYTVETVKNT